MPETEWSSSLRSYVLFVLLLCGIAVLLLALGWAPTRNLGGSAAVVAMIWGCSLSLAASILGLLPQVFGHRGSPLQAGTLALGALAIRMGVTLLGAVAIVLASAVPRRAFLIWVGISYLSFLVADVLIMVVGNRETQLQS
jgi:hypothetical protein